MKNILTIFFLVLLSFPIYSQDITGSWEGSLYILGAEVPLSVRIEKEQEIYTSYLNSQTHEIEELEADTTNIENSHLKLVFNEADIEFEGEYFAKDKVIKGNFEQSGISFPLWLVRNSKFYYRKASRS
ncbi:hypothetical protein ACW6QP_08030 [Salegentibacter sp. HM20]